MTLRNISYPLDKAGIDDEIHVVNEEKIVIAQLIDSVLQAICFSKRNIAENDHWFFDHIFSADSCSENISDFRALAFFTRQRDN